MIGRLKQWLGNKPDVQQQASDRLTYLESALGCKISPQEVDIFHQAFRHRSIIDDDKYKPYQTYERLEYLGDAVLDLIVSELLYEKYPEENEGFLTKLRAKIVKGETLAKLAREMNIQDVLEVGERVEAQKIEFSKSVLADIFEAFIAAIYLTKGYPFTQRFVKEVLNKHINIEQIQTKVENHKSVLMEYLQSEKLPLPEYEVISEDGPGHDKTFHIAVIINDEIKGKGRGKNKKEAEQLAAKKAIENMNVGKDLK